MELSTSAPAPSPPALTPSVSSSWNESRARRGLDKDAAKAWDEEEEEEEDAEDAEEDDSGGGRVGVVEITSCAAVPARTICDRIVSAARNSKARSASVVSCGAIVAIYSLINGTRWAMLDSSSCTDRRLA